MRQDPIIPGLVTRLHVTPTGMTVTTPTAKASTAGSLDVNGKPLINATARMDVGFEAHGSALFAGVHCDDDRTCAFTTKNGCEGTITGDGKGNVVLVTTGECGGWSGKWLMGRRMRPGRSARRRRRAPVPACAPCPPVTAPPTSPPNAPPPGSGSPDTTSCLSGVQRRPARVHPSVQDQRHALLQAVQRSHDGVPRTLPLSAQKWSPGALRDLGLDDRR